MACARMCVEQKVEDGKRDGRQWAARSSIDLTIVFVMAAALCLLDACRAGGQVPPVNVTTYQNDIGRTGQNLNETILTPANVNATQFGKLFSDSVDGPVNAQPLYLAGITVNGAVHNVLYVATANDSLYAFDADSNSGANAGLLWKASLLSAAYGAGPGATPFAFSAGPGSQVTDYGITGTPVIDPISGTIYVASTTVESGTNVERLHALDVTTGLEKFGGPVALSASVPGTGIGSVNGTLAFDPLYQSQRSALLLLNGIVYIAFASYADEGPWHGWILAYNASTLQPTGAFCDTPNGTGGGIWLSAGGLSADQLDPVNHPYGRMFAPTGNGDYTATSPYNSQMDYGDSDLDIDLTNGVLTIADEFTPSNQATLDQADLDIAAGGALILPTQTAGSYPHLLVQVDKNGTLYMLNRDNLGGYNTTADQIVQEQPSAIGMPVAFGKQANLSSPAYWNGNVYVWGIYDHLKSFQLANGILSTTPTISSETYEFPGATPSISANGNQQGIVWTIDSEGVASKGPAALQAHDASNVASTLYSSTTNPGRDTPGPAVKFTLPTVANGKVYLGAAGEVDVYGLLTLPAQVVAPVIAPGSSSFGGTVNVTMSDSTVYSSIFYTTDGSTATSASTPYTGPITVSATETINAIATAPGIANSTQTTAIYTLVTQATAVLFSLPTGIYTAAQSVSLADSTGNAAIYYTTDGSSPFSVASGGPSATSNLYTGPISVTATETITAIAIVPGIASSPIVAQTYTIESGLSGINFAQGFPSPSGLIARNGSAIIASDSLQLTTGAASQAGSAWYYAPVNIQSFTTDFTFEFLNSTANGITFAIQNAPAKVNALGGNASNLGYAPVANSLAVKFDLLNPAGGGSTGLYLNGAVPTTPDIDLTSSGISFISGDIMAVHMSYSGAVLSMTITDEFTGATLTTSWTVNISQSIGSNTAYVGFTGSTGSNTASEQILSWTYYPVAFATTLAAPSISPAAGTYASAQTVTISDATAGANIYYTINGAAPTTASTVYAGPISVATSETVQAIAVLGSTASAISASAYTINVATVAMPSFLPVAGAYSGAQTVTISDATAGATIYYTVNGTAPTTASTVYAGPISVATSETVQAIAVLGSGTSVIGTAGYTIAASNVTPTPAFSPAGGLYAAAQTVVLSDSLAGSSIYYTTNGTTPVASSPIYSTPISVTANETITAVAVGPKGYAGSSVASAVYTISSAPATPVFTPAAGTYTSTQTVTIASTTAGASVYYTTNGTTPTSGSTLYTGPISVAATETLKAVAIVGSTLSAVGSAAYTINTVSVATPVFSLAAGAYASTQTVTISDATAGATIYYTVNGVAPTTASTVYAGPISVATSETVQAIAVLGSATSFISTAAYTITASNVTPPPAFSPAEGLYATAQSVVLSETLAGSKIYYTTNGTTPTGSSPIYSTPISVTANETITAIAVGPKGYAGSSVTSAVYTISSAPATPVFTPAAGTYTSTQTVTIASTTAGASVYYTTNGAAPTSGSTLYTGPISVAATETLKAVAVVGSTLSAVGSAAYTINTVSVATPVFSLAAGTYASTQTVTISDATAGASIYYTINGSAPTSASTHYTGAISIASTETLQAIAVVGAASSAVGSAAYTISTSNITPMPTFSPVAGSYGAAQSVVLSDTLAGSKIYYTTNGTAPTGSSPVYSTPIAVTASETIAAIAVGPKTYVGSATATAAYGIYSSAATVSPTFSPGAGTYATPQPVTISDATAGAIIYYTTNGTTPTTASTIYSGPITVATSETLQAIAVVGSSASGVGAAGYTIQASIVATPGFSPVAGTYSSAQPVTISDTTPGASIYYTTDGTTPTTASTLYSGSILVGASETLHAIAALNGETNSAVGSAAYTISTSAPPAVNFSSGFTPTGLNLYQATIVNGALQLTDGGSSETRFGWFKTRVNVQSFTTDFTFQQTAALSDGFTFAIQDAPKGVWAVGGTGASLGYGGISSSLAVKFDLYNNLGEGSDSTGFYTAGAVPTTPALDMTSSGVNLHSGHLMHAHIVYNGTTLSLTLTDTVTGAVFTASTAINIPAVVGANTAYVGFTAATGSQSAVQNILTWTYTAN